MSGNAVKIGVAVVLLVAAGLIGLAFWTDTELGDRDYYYDESEGTLFVAAASLRAPIEGVGGAKGDGVRAVVGICGEADRAPTVDDILYLERFTPELIALFEENDRAAAEGRAGPGEVQDRVYLSEQTLVRAPGDTEWHAQSSVEGQAVLGRVREKCEDGSYPRLVTPDG